MGRATSRFLLQVGVFGLGLSILAAGSSGRADDARPAAEKAQAGDEALKEQLLKLNRVDTEESQTAKLRELVKDKDHAKRAVKLAVKLQKAEKGRDKPFDFGASIILARAAHYVKDYPAAEYFYTHCAETATRLESGEKMLQAYDGLIDLNWDQKKYQDVIDICERFVEIKGPKEVDDAKPFVLERLIQAKAKQGNFDEALRITEGLIQLTEGGWYFVQAKGWVQREAGKFGEAIDTYNDVIEKIDGEKKMPPDTKKRLKDRIHYVLSGLYVDNKEIDKAAEQLKTLMKGDPENPTYKNDLGFIWADHDKNLDESEKLIREALDLDKERQERLVKEGKLDEVKENAAYLDSMGWVLFKQKKYKEALPYLQKAAADEEDGNHLEIWDHLGDVYMALDKKKEAIDAYQKGLTMEDVSRRDIERRKQVTAKLKAEGVEPKAAPKKKETAKPKRKID
jgi:tetratricopeptide (TPR) repeat protein